MFNGGMLTVDYQSLYTIHVFSFWNVDDDRWSAESTIDVSLREDSSSQITGFEQSHWESHNPPFTYIFFSEISSAHTTAVLRYMNHPEYVHCILILSNHCYSHYFFLVCNKIKTSSVHHRPECLLQQTDGKQSLESNCIKRWFIYIYVLFFKHCV